MKMTDTAIVHHLSNVDENIAMGIRIEDFPHIQTVLTDLYSDPILAVIREYSTNAWDANVEAGYDGPVEVTLPPHHGVHALHGTTSTLTFTVRDYGPGLTPDDIRDIYSMYGRSTKRGSNDVVGMLGLGCKSGLTYALSFTITSVCNGLMTIAAMTKDELGRGQIKILDTAATDRANGTIIQIPVKPEDVAQFHQKAQEFYQYWRPGTVLIDGEEPDRSFLEDAIWMDENTAILKEAGKSKIVMGNVAYPFTPEGFNHSIITDVWIGNVAFPPSREALQYNATTNETLDELMKWVKTYFSRALEKRLATVETNWERSKILADWNRGGSVINRRNRRQTSALVVMLPRERKAWQYDPNEYRPRARKIDNFIDWYRLRQTGTALITDFPSKSTSVVHKERLAAFLNNKSWILIPNGADTSFLDGRPNMHSWDHVLAATTAIKAPSVPKEDRARTVYTGLKAGARIVGEEFDVADGPICWSIAYVGSPDITRLTVAHPEVQVLYLRERQVDRFKRLHPTATDFSVYHDEKVKELMKQVPEDDLIKVACPRHFLPLQGRQDLVDPDLRRISRVQTQDFSDAMKTVRSWGVKFPPHKIYDEVLARYPLFEEAYRWGRTTNCFDELVIYMNAKATRNMVDSATPVAS